MTAERFVGRDCDDHNPDIGDCDLDGDDARAIAAGGDDADSDGDGAGPASCFCEPPAGPGWSTNNGDCDDLRADVNATAWYRDADGDGFGDAAQVRYACVAPLGYVADASDCDDAAQGALATTWFRDADGDGYPTENETLLACVPPVGYTLAPMAGGRPLFVPAAPGLRDR